MRRARLVLISGLCFAAILGSSVSLSSEQTQDRFVYVSIGRATPTRPLGNQVHVLNGIPFWFDDFVYPMATGPHSGVPRVGGVGGVNLYCPATFGEEGLYSARTSFPDGYGVYSALHILATADYCVSMTAGTTVAYVRVGYRDGTESSLSLVIGQNVGDRCSIREEEACRAHPQLQPVYRFPSMDCPGCATYYSMLKLEKKELAYIDVSLGPRACLGRPVCQGSDSSTTSLRVLVEGMTLERPQS